MFIYYSIICILTNMYECKNCNAKIVEWEVAEAEMDRTRKQRDQNHQIAIQR